jgi:Alpha galactosidase A/Alpha galactosidase C-terminal beta sandwich domain/Alpha-galactosidase, CBM13 domain
MVRLQRRQAAMRAPVILLALLSILCGSSAARAQGAVKQIPIPLPPMGWSSWNSFSNTVDSKIIMEQAKTMVDTGMSKLGYRYINIDEGWWLGDRDKDGNIVVEAARWPAIGPNEHAGDMANIVRYIHSLGLKAGIYTDAGHDGCSMYPDLGPVYQHTGSEDHYEQDFLQFAKWGFDYVKVDWCGGDKENLDPAVQYAEIARAIQLAAAKTGRHLYFSICNWGKQSPWTWGPNVGGVAADIWRTSGDIVAPIVANSKNSDRKASFEKMLGNFDQGIHPEAEHTGFYNDPDMMVIGMPGLTDAQNRVHMTLWAISGAPLLVGADLTTLSAETLATLSNAEVLAVDQDALGLQAVKVAEPGAGLEVWSKPLSKAGERAVVLLNRTAAEARISFRASELGLLDGSPAVARDLWEHKDLGSFTGADTLTVPAQDAMMLVVRGVEPHATVYKPTRSIAGPDTTPLTSAASGDKVVAALVRAGSPVEFAHVASRSRFARVQIAYTNPEKETRFAELRVNGRIATRVAFPSTGSSASVGVVSVESLLDRKGATNVLNFSTVCAAGPAIVSISVE